VAHAEFAFEENAVAQAVLAHQIGRDEDVLGVGQVVPRLLAEITEAFGGDFEEPAAGLGRTGGDEWFAGVALVRRAGSALAARLEFTARRALILRVRLARASRLRAVRRAARSRAIALAVLPAIAPAAASFTRVFFEPLIARLAVVRLPLAVGVGVRVARWALLRMRLRACGFAG
jgi:hypothetical protein